MKRNYISAKTGWKALGLLLLFAVTGTFQVTSGQTYCIPSFTYVGNYGIGMQTVTVGNMTNATGAPNGTVTYFDYTSMRVTAAANSTVNVSILIGNSNSTSIGIFVDWNNDGTFSATEQMVLSGSNNPSTTYNTSFNVPAAQAPGVYRMRVIGDLGSQTPNNPCAIGYTGEAEDYSFVVTSATMDVAVFRGFTGNALQMGNNTISISGVNLSNSTINTVDIGYNINNGTPVTESLSAMGLASGAMFSKNFNVPLNIGTPGNYTLKIWVRNPNGTGAGVNGNDTITRVLKACNPLSGTYTIDASGSGSNNYVDFTSATFDLATCGISGPVVFNVAAGTYTEQVSIPSIPGASAANTVLFQGAGVNSTLLTFGNQTTADKHTLRFNGTSRVTVRDMTIRSTNSTNAFTVHFTGTQVNDNAVVNCTIDNAGGVSTTSTTVIPVVFAGNTYTTNVLAFNNRVDSCTIIGGYANISFYGNTTGNANYGNYFRNNTMTSSYQYAVYANYLHSANIIGNTIVGRTTGSMTTGSMGIYLANSNNSYPYIHNISDNVITDMGQYGIYIASSSGSTGSKGLMSNNMVGGGFKNTSSAYGIYFSFSTWWNVYFNSVNMDANVTGEEAALYVAGSTNQFNVDVRNNLLQVTGNAGQPWPLWGTANTVFSDVDYNSYWAANGSASSVIYLGGALSNTGLIGAYGFNSNSQVRSVAYAGVKNLHHAAGCLTGIYLSQVPKDIDGTNRSSVPVIGADEFTNTSTDDIGVIAVSAPVAPVSAGAQNLEVVLKNFGSNVVTSAQLTYVHNGGSPVTINWTGTLNPCATVKVAFSGSSQVNLVAGVNNFSVNSSLPNGNADNSTSNDRLDFRICPGMSGTYTVNAAGGGDFTSLTQAIDALACAGMDGPVTLMVAAGTYSEQVTIKGIAGLSTTRRLVIDGGEGNAATRIVTFNNSQNTSRHTILIENQSGVSLRNLTIRNQSPSYGWPVHGMGANMSTIEVVKCIVEITGTGATSTSTNFSGIVFSNSTTSATTSGIYTNIRIDSNVVKGGYYGITLYGNGTVSSVNNQINRNQLSNIYYYGTYLVSNFGVKLTGNDITMRLGNVNSMGVYFISNNTSSGGYFSEVAYNKVVNAGAYGMYFQTSNYAAARGKIHNNMIGGGFSSTTARGIYMTSSSYWDIFFNSINVDFLVTSANGSAFYATSSNYLDVRNNQFALTAPTLNNGTIFPVYMNGSTSLVCDYNNYYKLGNTTSFIRINGVNYTAANYKGGGGFNTNSYFVDPGFVGAKDLHSNNGCAIGVNISGYTTDFDGDTRASVPTIGADEGVALDLSVVSFTAPSGTTITGTNDVVFRVRNTGRTTITGFTAAYSVNGGTAVTQAWTGTLDPCAEATITFTGGQAYTAGSGLQGIVVFVNNLAQGADQRSSNDSMSNVFCSGPFAGTYTINPTGKTPTNFKSFNALVNSLAACGMNGNVHVNVAEGVYTEQVQLVNTIPGIEAYKLSFDGGDPNKTILTFAGGIYTLRLNGVDQVSVKNMGIENTATSSAFGVHLTNAADSNTFDNCRIIVPTVSNTTVIAFGIMGATYTATGAYWGSDNVLKNSYISGGYVSVHVYSGGTAQLALRNKILNNYITGSATYATQIYYQSNMEFIGNRLEQAGATYGGYFYYCPYITITENHFYGLGSYALYCSQVSPSGFGRSKIANNMIGGMTGNGTIYGMYNTSCYDADYYHNTVFMHANNGAGRAFYLSTGSGNNLKNNIFHNEAPTGYALYLNTTGPFTSSDYNNVYSTGLLAYLWGTNVYDLDGLKQGVSPQQANSVSQPALFVNKNFAMPDLHLNQSAASPYGDKSVVMPFDIDGDPRCALATAIGADESNFAFPAKALFSVSDTVFVNSPFKVINAASPTALMGYAWDFDNDGSVESNDRNAEHTFATAGLKQIKLKSSTCFASDSMVKTTRVVAPTQVPVADFIADRYSVAPFEEIKFTDLSTNGPTGWTWEVNPYDPFTFFTPDEYSANPTIFMATPGVYEVCLTAQNNVGTSAKKCKTAYITVKDANNMCVGNLSSTAADGEIYDSGGPTAPYGPNENCTFLIQPCATSVTLKFSQFNLGNAGHFLRIYDGPDANSPLIGVYSSTSGLPGGSAGLTATSGAMYLTWTTNNLGAAAGFAATWTSTPKTNNQTSIGFSIPDSALVREEVSFTNTSVGDELNYEWDLDGDGFVDAFDENPVFEYTTPGLYYAKLTITDACGTNLSHTDSIVVVNPVGPPVADFMADVRLATMNDTVRLIDLSTNGAYDWTYTITPATFNFVGGSDANPLIKFNALGLYEVSLTAENDNGTHSVTKTAYIRVVNICQPTVSGLVADVGINRVKLNNLDNTSASGVAGYNNYFGDMRVGGALLDLSGTYELIVSRNSTLNKMNRKAWIDYNADGDFDDAGELIGSEAGSLNQLWSLTFTVPATASEGALRLRIGAAFGDSTNLACGPNFFGEVEDYRVVISTDRTPPMITLLGSNPILLPIGTSYTDPGATAWDAVDGDVSANIVMTHNINNMVSGDYTVRYNVEDAAGNDAVEVTRTVTVLPDITPPVLQLNTPLVLTLPLLSTFNEPGFSASDLISGNVTSSIIVDRGNYDSSKVGTYAITYVGFDGSNNSDTQVRIIHIVDVTAPVITLNGANPLQLPVYSAFSDPGVLVSDNYDPVVVASVSHNVNTMVLGNYEIHYLTKDAAGNTTLEKRMVEVVDITAPTIEVAGTDTIFVEVHRNLDMPDIWVEDNYDANPTLSITGTYDLSVIGNYTIGFVAEDGSGNTSATVSRVIAVVDRTKPVITLNGTYLMNVERWTTFVDPGVVVTDNYYSGLTATTGGNFLNTTELGLYYITYNVTDGSGNQAVEVVRAINVVDNTTGLEEADGRQLNVYPNPTRGKVTLEISSGSFDPQQVVVTNLMGQKVKLESVAGGDNHLVLNLGQLPSGVYFVQVSSGNKMYMARVVVAD